MNKYHTWVLVGYLMGRTILHLKKGKYQPQIESKTGMVTENIHRGVIKRLCKRNYLHLSKDKSEYILTSYGYNVAYNRIRKSKPFA